METIRRLAVLLLSLVATVSQAAQDGPDTMLRVVTSEVSANLRQDRDLAENPLRLEGLIETRITPIFDFSMMAQLAMGKNWRLATPQQQNRLTAEFQAMLIRTYSGMLTTYRNAEITYKPIRFVPGDTDATVRSEVKQPGSKALRVDYEMTKTAKGWKVYDVKLDSVSVVTAYREGFASKIRDAGVDGLIRSLAEKNRSNVSGATALAGG